MVVSHLVTCPCEVDCLTNTPVALQQAATEEAAEWGCVSKAQAQKQSTGEMREPAVATAPEALVARTGRSHQRYDKGFRLVAGCIPFRTQLGADGVAEGGLETVQVLMITSQHGQGLLFPKGGWETDETAEEAACREAMEEAGVRGNIQRKLGTYEFRSKRLRNDECKDGDCRAHVFVLAVTEEMEQWPEKERRERFWLPVKEAVERCRHDWMRGALEQWADSLTT